MSTRILITIANSVFLFPFLPMRLLFLPNFLCRIELNYHRLLIKLLLFLLFPLLAMIYPLPLLRLNPFVFLLIIALLLFILLPLLRLFPLTETFLLALRVSRLCLLHHDVLLCRSILPLDILNDPSTNRMITLSATTTIMH